MKKRIIIITRLLIGLTVLLGFLYPGLITAIGTTAFQEKVNGTLVFRKNGKPMGSVLMAQNCSSEIYFQSRPSAIDYNPLPSGGSNLAPSSAALADLVVKRRADFIRVNGLEKSQAVPVDMVFASASGVDPHISPEAAKMQMHRIAHARHFTEGDIHKLQQIIDELTEKPQFGIFGNPRVNVLLLNIKLDEIENNG